MFIWSRTAVSLMSSGRLMTMPIAPSSLCAHIRVTVR